MIADILARDAKLGTDRVKAIEHIKDRSHLVRGSLGDGEEATPLGLAVAASSEPSTAPGIRVGGSDSIGRRAR